MTENSGFILLVITFTLYVGALTEPCSVRHPEYKKAGEEFYKAFTDVVKKRISEPNSDSTTVITDVLREKSLKFLDVGNKTCQSGLQDKNYNYDYFFEIINFSLRNVTVLKDLHLQDGFKCIKKQKPVIDNCVNSSLTSATRFTNHTKNGRLMGKAHLNFDSLTCHNTKLIRKCTLDILKTHCKPEAANYVESLFDFVNKTCKAVAEKITSPSGSPKLTGYGATFTILALWSGLVIFF